jgi:phenylacetate-CoA ligase
VNIYPAAIKAVVTEFMPRTTGVFRIMLDSPGPLVTPPLKVKVEYGVQDMNVEEKKSLVQEMTGRIRDSLRVNPSIELVSPNSLPREAGKTSLVEIKQKIFK